MLRLYDLAAADPAIRFSPYCWRVHLALMHKGLPFETVPWRFRDRGTAGFAGATQVPVLIDGESVIPDSWRIAEYLDEHYPQRPALFDGEGGKQHARFVAHWIESVVHPLVPAMIALDVFKQLDDEDKAYYRASREKRYGTTLEAYVAGREQTRTVFAEALAPLRRVLNAQPFVCGAAPAFADYVVFGIFQWARSGSRFPVLLDGDPVATWRGRMLDLFGGYAARFPACP